MTSFILWIAVFPPLLLIVYAVLEVVIRVASPAPERAAAQPEDDAS